MTTFKKLPNTSPSETPTPIQNQAAARQSRHSAASSSGARYTDRAGGSSSFELAAPVERVQISGAADPGVPLMKI